MCSKLGELGKLQKSMLPSNASRSYMTVDLVRRLLFCAGLELIWKEDGEEADLKCASVESRISGEMLKRPSNTMRSLSDPNVFEDVIAEQEETQSEHEKKNPRKEEQRISNSRSVVCNNLSNVEIWGDRRQSILSIKRTTASESQTLRAAGVAYCVFIFACILYSLYSHDKVRFIRWKRESNCKRRHRLIEE